MEVAFLLYPHTLSTLVVEVLAHSERLQAPQAARPSVSKISQSIPAIPIRLLWYRLLVYGWALWYKELTRWPLLRFGPGGLTGVVEHSGPINVKTKHILI